MSAFFSQKKNRLFLLLLLGVFFVGVAGRLLFSDTKAHTVTLTLSVRSFPEDNLLFEGFPFSASDATLDGVPVTVTSLSVLPATRTETAVGEGVKEYPSRLTKQLYATLRLEGEERDGHFFVGGVYLPVGKETLLRTDGFVLTVRVLEIKIE
jgi:hypothetical protein